jgi:2-oxoglutarate dehydrogenase E2 component (dihydrolipoamide succinyltransferase)
MIIDVVMPKMGESLQEGTIIKWTKKVGDKIERDETILEITTDKVDTEVPAPSAGILKSILFGENETVEVGKKIAEIDTDANASVEVPAASAPALVAVVPEPIPVAAVPEPAPVPAPVSQNVPSGNLTDIVMPKMGESLQEGTIIKWTKKVGDKIERDETILEITTDKVDTEVPAPVSGVLAEILFEENETVEVGKVIARISSGSAVVSSPAPSAPAPSATAAVAPAPAPTPVVAQVPAPVVGTTFDIPARDGEKFFSPLVREIAKQNSISLEELRNINGTGLDGRVSKNDILNYISNRSAAPAPIAAPVQTVSAPAPAVAQPKPAQPAAPAFAGEVNPIFRAAGEFDVVPMDRIRQLISEHMTRSKATSAHVTSVAEADVTDIVKLREKYKDSFFQREGIKLTYTPFFAQAAVDAIKKFPNVNVGVDGNNVIKFKHINLSIATALDDGNLIVPVIKKAEELNLTGLARSVNDLALRARTKKLNPDDIQGGTFSITNVGTFGTLFGTPVINQPQTAIMGIGAIQKRPVVKEVLGNDMIVVRHMAYVSITYDHRVIDGMLAGQCLAAIVKSLESMNEQTITL